METQNRIINASRAYEYRTDDIRLTVLSMPEVVERIRKTFGFESAEVDSPPPLFGPVPRTFPPGLVFDIGVLADANIPTPIRFLHIEQRRVVVAVAGPSSAIDEVFRQLNETVSDVFAPDGTPALGHPVGTKDHSDIRIQLPFAPEMLVPGPIRTLFGQTLEPLLPGTKTAIVPRLLISIEPLEQEYRPSESIVQQAISLELRQDTNIQDRIYYSQAPLATDEHLAFLAKVADVDQG
jgi:hypothetical protein